MRSRQRWIDDGSMVIRCFVAALEIEREVLVAELSEVREGILPVSATTAA